MVSHTHTHTHHIHTYNIYTHTSCTHHPIHTCITHIKHIHVQPYRVPTVTQGKRTWPVSMQTWVRSLALLGGLRMIVAVCCGLELWCGSQMWPRSRIAVAVARPSAVALSGPLAWNFHMLWVALRRRKKKNQVLLIFWLDCFLMLTCMDR